ncbi:MAG: RNA polymerase sigma factor [Mangrovibacterium sp.]
MDSLWQRFRQGNYAVLGDLFQNLYKELYYYGLKLVLIPDLVKDTIQDIFADIWLRREKMSEVNNIKAYLFISVRHELLKRLEKLRKENILKENRFSSFEFSKEDFIVKEETEQETAQRFVQSLQSLTERQREVILLRFNHELEFQEIAFIMGMNVQSVRNLLFRALEKIRKDMNSSGIKGRSDIEIFLMHIFQQQKTFRLSESKDQTQFEVLPSKRND